MISRTLLVCSLLECGALALNIVDQASECKGSYTEALQADTLGRFFGIDSLQLGDGREGQQIVSWETAGRRVISLPFNQSKDYTMDYDNTAPKTAHWVEAGYPYGFEPPEKTLLYLGLETATQNGCSIKGVRVASVKEDQLTEGMTVVGGLGPVPKKPTHELLGGRAPRVSFCFHRESGTGQLVWGAPAPRADGSHLKLRVNGGMNAHHWAVNVTGFKLAGLDPLGPEAMAEKTRLDNKDDRDKYWTALFSTGERGLTVPQTVLDDMSKHLDMTNLVRDCKNTSRLPTLLYELDGQEYSVPPEAYLSSNSDKRVMMQSALHFRPQLGEGEALPADSCYMLFAPPTPYPGVFVLGMPFLQQHTITYDYENRVILTKRQDGPCSQASRSRGILAFAIYFVAIAMSFGAATSW